LDDRLKKALKAFYPNGASSSVSVSKFGIETKLSAYPEHIEEMLDTFLKIFN
jgi:hypothetical protein